MTIFELNFYWFVIAPTYYWMMYLIWFVAWYYIVRKRNKIFINIMDRANTKILLDDLLFHIFWWVILWWRLWYVLFYNFSYYINNIVEIFKIWKWWMSFHGWVIGVIIWMYLFSRKYKLSFLNISDQITSVLPIWLWLWRIWNFLNKELLWFHGYYWPFSIDWRFPSPLLEALLEWVLLFIILNYYYPKKRFHWQIAALFLIYYWIFRLFVEFFFRMPDENIGYLFNYFTVGELLTAPMILVWLFYYFYLDKKNKNGIQ